MQGTSFFGHATYIVKRGSCYDKVCLSVCLFVTLVSHTYTVQDIEMN